MGCISAEGEVEDTGEVRDTGELLCDFFFLFCKVRFLKKQ